MIPNLPSYLNLEREKVAVLSFIFNQAFKEDEQCKKGRREPEVSLVKLQNLVMEDDSEISHHVG